MVFLHNMILYGILTVLNLFAIIGGFKPNFRIWACCGYCFAMGYYIFVAISTSLIRFSDAGIYCTYAPYPGGIFTEHGAFLKKMIIC